MYCTSQTLDIVVPSYRIDPLSDWALNLADDAPEESGRLCELLYHQMAIPWDKCPAASCRRFGDSESPAFRMDLHPIGYIQVKLLANHSAALRRVSHSSILLNSICNENQTDLAFPAPVWGMPSVD